MDEKNRGLKIVVGVVVFVAAFWFIRSSGLITELLTPSVESGRLGTPTATVLAVVLEILAAVGGAAIVVTTSLYRAIVAAFGASVPDRGSSASDQPEIDRELANLLVRVVMEKDRDLTIAVAERLAGEKYLTRPADGE